MTTEVSCSLPSSRESRTLKTISCYGIAILPVFLVIIIKFFLPELQQNEAGKLVSVRQVFDPSFLSHDWAVARGCGDNVFDLVFAVLIAPFWLWLRNSILVALAARLLCWGILLAALVKLSRTLTIEWYALSCSLGVWICNGQNLGAGEWIFRSAEAKCLAYALLLFAMDAALRKKLLRAGICCGLAICCHILVGAWGSVALGGALLLCYRGYGWRRIVQFMALIAGVSIPVVIIAVLYAVPGTPAERQASNRLAVSFSDSFHLDPSYFGGWQVLAVASVLAVGAALAFFKVTARPQAKLLCSFLAMLILEFMAGLLAWKLNQFWFLKSFPFRVPDVLIFLFFMLAVPCFLGRLIAKLGKQVREDGFRPCSGHAWRRRALLFSLVCIVFAGFLRDLDTVLKDDLPVFVGQWQQYIYGPKTSWQEMTEWIRDNTPKSAIIMAPPWEYTFWLDAERAQVVSYKRPPHNARLLEWYRRLTAMNGGAFHSRGSEVRDELRKNYPQLSLVQIETICNQYSADYYLTTQERGDLSGNLVHVSGSYYLYRLRRSGIPY